MSIQYPAHGGGAGTRTVHHSTINSSSSSTRPYSAPPPSGADAVQTTAVAPSWGDRLLAESHEAKCLFLKLVRRFLQEYKAQVDRYGPDLFINTCNYRQSTARRSALNDTAHLTLVPSMEWSPMYPVQHTSDADARIYWILQPYVPHAVVTLPHVPGSADRSSSHPAGYSDAPLTDMIPLCEPLILSVTILCAGTAVDRSMNPSNLHEIPGRASAAHRAGRKVGIFYHALAQEPMYEYQEDTTVLEDGGICPSEYLSKTSDGVRVVMYNAGVAEREHPTTRELMPSVALGLRDVHLSMDDLFSSAEPPRWPMVLAFMQLCKKTLTPQMSEKAKAVLEGYRNARYMQHTLEDKLLCSEFLSNSMSCAPAYSQMQESHTWETLQRQQQRQYGEDVDYDEFGRPMAGRTTSHRQPMQRRTTTTAQEPFGASNKPSCVIC